MLDLLFVFATGLASFIIVEFILAYCDNTAMATWYERTTSFCRMLNKWSFYYYYFENYHYVDGDLVKTSNGVDGLKHQSFIFEDVVRREYNAYEGKVVLLDRGNETFTTFGEFTFDGNVICVYKYAGNVCYLYQLIKVTKELD